MTFIFRLWPAIEDGRLDHATVWTKELSDLLLRGTFSHVPDGDLVSGFHHEHDRGDPHGLWRWRSGAAWRCDPGHEDCQPVRWQGGVREGGFVWWRSSGIKISGAGEVSGHPIWGPAPGAGAVSGRPSAIVLCSDVTISATGEAVKLRPDLGRRGLLINGKKRWMVSEWTSTKGKRRRKRKNWKLKLWWRHELLLKMT